MTTPAEHGFIAWSYDPTMAVSQAAPTDAEVYLIGVRLRFPRLVTNVHAFVGVAGATVTASFAGLYTAAGARLGTSASINTALESTGFKTFALTSTVQCDPGFYYIALLSGGGGTDCQWNRAGSPTVFAGNAGLTDVAHLRYATGATSSQATLPTTIVPEASGAIPYWAALS